MLLAQGEVEAVLILSPDRLARHFPYQYIVVEDFCRNINSALDNPSFETKRKILRLVVDRVEFVEGQITIKHVIPVSDVRLRRNQHF